MALKELIGSREEEYSGSGYTATRIFHVEWDLRSPAFNLFGTIYPDNWDPFHPRRCVCICGKPEPKDDPLTNRYPTANITAKYEWRPGDDETEEIRQTVEFNTSVISREAGDADFYLKLDGKTNDNAVKVDLGVQVPLIQFSMVKTFKQPKLPKKFAEKVGCVNNGPFQGWDKKKVLFAGASARPFYDVKGNKVWDMTFNFVVNVIHLWTEAWNTEASEEIPDHKEDKFRELKIPLYPSTDFSKIM